MRELATYYKAIQLTGSLTQVESAKRWFKEKGVIDDLIESGEGSVILADVPSTVIPNLKKVAAHLGFKSMNLIEPYEVEIEVTPVPVKKVGRTLNLATSKWYYADALEDQYPFVFVREVSASDEIQKFDVDLLPLTNGLPKREVLSAEELSKFGLRPATPDDFDNFDIPIPVSRFLTEGKVQQVEPKLPLKHLSSFAIEPRVASKVEVPPPAVASFVDLMQTQLANWLPSEEGYEATVQDEDTVHYVNELVGEWAREFKYPQRDAKATATSFSWNYSLPGNENNPSVVEVKATKSVEDTEAVGPWTVTINPMWGE